MRRKTGYLLREIGGQKIVVAVGERTRDFTGMITFTESGALLWEALGDEQTESSLTQRLTSAYDVPCDQAAADVHRFVCKMREAGLLDES